MKIISWLKEYGVTTNFRINGKTLYDFDKVKGILQVSASSNDLEILLEQIGEIPKEGIDLALQTPIGVPSTFEGVKKIESIPGLKEEEYIMKIEKVSKNEKFQDSIKNYFRF